MRKVAPHKWLVRRFSVAALMVLVFAMQAKRAMATDHTARQFGEAVKDIEVRITFVTPEMIPGERLIVKLELENKGRGPAVVPSAEGLNALRYVLRSSETGRDPIYLSQAAAQARGYPKDNFPPEPVPMITIQPGAVVDYDDDIGLLAVEPLRPGRYSIVVGMPVGDRLVESAPRTFVVLETAAVAATMAVDADERKIVQVLASSGAGGVSLLRRDVNADSPMDGIWYRHVGLPLVPPLVGVAIVPRRDSSKQGRWFAWATNQALGAAISENWTKFGQLAPVSLGLRSQMLCAIGWEPVSNEAIFVALGSGDDGHVVFAEARFRIIGNSSEVKKTSLALSRMPSLWAAQRDAGANRFAVVAAEPKGSGARIVQQACSPAKGASEKQIVLFDTPDPIVALALDPDPVANAVDVLLGPVSKPEPKMTLLRLPLGGGAPLATWHFGLPRPGAGVRKMWAITLPSTRAPVVLASDGQRIDALQPGNGAAWVKIEEAVGAATHLTALTFADKGVWASWFDSHGARFARAR